MTKNLDSRLLLISIFALAINGLPPPYPPTVKAPVTDSYFGVKVKDPYRWLEDGSAPKVRQWADDQTNLAIKFIHSVPDYSRLHRRIEKLERNGIVRSTLTIAHNRLVYLRTVPDKPQPLLVARDGVAEPERVLFDPRTQSANSSIESIFLSPDGSKIAFTTQIAGSENETLHVVDATNGVLLKDVISNVGGGLSPTALLWDADSNGFLHTVWPRQADGTYANSGILLVVEHIPLCS